MNERVERELQILREAGQKAQLVEGSRLLVIYHDLPTAAEPEVTDVAVPVPNSYGASPIDLAGLPSDSPLLPRLKGGNNLQFDAEADGRTWRFASYHPYGGGHGATWDPMKEGYHTYLGYILSWLQNLQ